jgi:Domain of unknown function (DUF4258)
VSQARVVFRLHAVRRMFERRIAESDVREVLGNGETIETYPDDVPYPSRLVLGWAGRTRPLHVVVADNVAMREMIVVTVYEPDLTIWLPGFRRRRAQ